ncbi:MAG: TVP38/TMEM64 family protein [Candidatus Binatia bacterium]
MSDATPSGPVSRLARVGGLIVAIGVLFVVGRRAGAYVPAFAAWVNELGAWGPIAFIVGYAAAVVLLVPAVLLTLAGGAVFGLVQGTLYVFVAAVAGSIGAFLISRYVARGLVEKRLGANPRVAAIDRAVAAQGLRIVFLLRLSPAFPFVLLNYALGLTRVRFADYALASFGMIPGTILYVYYGKLVGDVASLGSGHSPPRGAAYYALTIVGLAATIGVTTLVARIARRAVREATGESSGT